MDRWGDHWRFTGAAVQRLFGDFFGSYDVHVNAHGNVLVATAFFYGMAADDLTTEELDFADRHSCFFNIEAGKSEGCH
jgi:hypothetical protein